MDENKKLRPTKKQKQALDFIKKFIIEHGYGPSYREIMKGCNYNSVATVALHVNNLIQRGHLSKKGRSARSLEVLSDDKVEQKIVSNQVKPSEEKWLVEKVEYYFKKAESSSHVTQSDIDRLYVLVGALKVLGLEGAHQSFVDRLAKLKDSK